MNLISLSLLVSPYINSSVFSQRNNIIEQAKEYVFEYISILHLEVTVRLASLGKQMIRRAKHFDQFLPMRSISFPEFLLFIEKTSSKVITLFTHLALCFYLCP